MLRNTYLYEKVMFTNKVSAVSFWVVKEKEVALIKRVKLTWEFEEMLEVVHSGSKKLELIYFKIRHQS
jgi:hypothetical protein